MPNGSPSDFGDYRHQWPNLNLGKAFMRWLVPWLRIQYWNHFPATDLVSVLQKWWVSQIQSKATMWSKLLMSDTEYRWFPPTHLVLSPCRSELMAVLWPRGYHNENPGECIISLLGQVHSQGAAAGCRLAQCACVTSTGAFRSAVDVSGTGFFE